MTKRKVSWEGAFPANVTPFTKDGDIDEALLRENIRMTVDEGSHGIVVCGHNAEAHLMTQEERKRVIAISIEEVNGRIPVIAGTGAIATDVVIRQTKDARDMGADGAMIEPPYFMKPKPADSIAHYARITDAVDIPIMVYNVPGRAGVDLTTDVIEQAAEVSNICAVKDSCHIFERMMEMIQRFGDRINVFIGPQGIWGFPGVILGAMGYVDGLQQICGREGTELYDLAKARDYERGIALQHRLHPLRTIIFQSASTSPASLKDAMRLMGRPCGYPRPPLRLSEGEDLRRLEQGLRDHGFLAKAAAE